VKSIDSVITTGEAETDAAGNLIVKDAAKVTPTPEEPTVTTGPYAPYIPVYVTTTTVTTAADITTVDETTTVAAETTPEDDEDDVTEEQTSDSGVTKEETFEEIEIEESSDDTTEDIPEDTDTTTPNTGGPGIVTDSGDDNPHTYSGRVISCVAMLVPEIAVIVAAGKRKKDSEEDSGKED